MNKKPNFSTTKEKRLLEAQQELERESIAETVDRQKKKAIQTTLILDEDLYLAIQEVGLKRKRAGVKPYTLVGMVREALQEIVEKEHR